MFILVSEITVVDKSIGFYYYVTDDHRLTGYNKHHSMISVS